MNFVYQYLQIENFILPAIRVTLWNENKKVETMALVDSGASNCTFHGDLTYMLDIDLTRLKKISIKGVGDEVEGYASELDIEIERKGKTKRVHCPVDFSFDATLDGLGILGQNGFFDEFIIEFDKKNKMIRFIDPT